ncbi:MAG: hypothetical protein SGI77_07445 [Pirellulaceae bacterium]|nr:hypothetical protein [Pirellulaceae bacterium]
MIKIIAVGQPDVPPLDVPDRFRMEVVYFMTPGDHPEAPKLAPDEYWIRSDEARQWLDDGIVSLVSPLAADATADIELTEYHERWLEWLLENNVEHIRLCR